MQEHHLNIHILSVLVEEVLQEVGDRLVGDVATDHDVSATKEIILLLWYHAVRTATGEWLEIDNK